MTGDLIIFPVRVSARVVRFALRTSVEVTSRALSLTAQAIRSAKPDGSTEAPEPTMVDRVPSGRPAAPPPPPQEAAPPLRAEPVHVSEEPTVVEEFAEPGAEEGAGAEVHISEPWPGYSRLNAADVIERIAAATAEELAAVELYEVAHRDRATVVAAVERELRAKSGRGTTTADQTRKEYTHGQDAE
jgi:hypothetical protein